MIQRKIKKIKAFTLVELIIVITILAILATIAFLSFNNYTKNSRDSNRLATISNMEKALGVFFVGVGTYPTPNDVYGTGTYSGSELSQVGYIKDQIANLVKFNSVPKDPLGNNFYVYGVSHDKKHFQVATALESLQVSNSFIAPTYANTFQSRVTGEYRGLIKKEGKIYNLPSLIFSGSGNLLSSETYFIVDKGSNIPYAPNGGTVVNTQSTQEVLNHLGSTATTITGVTIPTTQAEFLAQSGTFRTELGYPLQEIGKEIFGESFTAPPEPVAPVVPTNSCATTPTNAVTVVGTPSSPNQTWQTSNSSGACYYTCNAGYGSTGTGCIAAPTCTSGVSEITLSNGQIWSCLNVGATTVWDGSSTFNCTSSTDCSNKPTWVGEFYQWGSNTPTGTGTWNTTITTNKNAWGGSGTTTGAGTGGSVGPANLALMQGACPAGRHIPTSYEFTQACASIGGCTPTNMKSKLRIGASGYRNYNDGTYYMNNVAQPTVQLHTSTPYNDNTNAYIIFIYSGMINSTETYPRTIGNPIRCIKN